MEPMLKVIWGADGTFPIEMSGDAEQMSQMLAALVYAVSNRTGVSTNKMLAAALDDLDEMFGDGKAEFEERSGIINDGNNADKELDGEG